jgi:hypothetical protein
MTASGRSIHHRLSGLKRQVSDRLARLDVDADQQRRRGQDRLARGARWANQIHTGRGRRRLQIEGIAALGHLFAGIVAVSPFGVHKGTRSVGVSGGVLNYYERAA